MASKKVGIDNMVTYVPRHYLDMSMFERQRGIRAGHVTGTIGIDQMAVIDAHEDAATMGANALLSLMRQDGIRPSSLDSIYVGTESMDNKSQPVAVKVLGNLEEVYGRGSLGNVGAVDYVHACAGGTYAVLGGYAWASNGHGNGGGARGLYERFLETVRLRAARDHNSDKVIGAIAVDYSRYPFLDAGESTQGAAAVAMIIKKDPRLLVLEPAVGKASGYGKGWHKPLDMEYPVKDGDLSIAEYLYGMKIAYQQFVPAFLKSSHITLKPGEAPTDYIDYAAFHQPNTKMVNDAVAYLLMHEWRDLPRWQQIEMVTGPLPGRKDYTVEELMSKEYKEFRRRFTATPQFNVVWDKKVLPTTRAGRLIGNSYAAALWAGVDGLVETEGRRVDLAGKRLAYGSFGSGWTAVVGSGVFQEGYREVADRMDLFRRLNRRTPVSFDDYLKLHDIRRGEGTSLRPPGGGEFGISGVGNGGKYHGHRDYKFYE